MTKLIPINRNDFVKKLRAFGFEGPYSGGKHSFMVKGKIRLTLPKPSQKRNKPGLIIMLATTSWHNKTRLDKPLKKWALPGC